MAVRAEEHADLRILARAILARARAIESTVLPGVSGSSNTSTAAAQSCSKWAFDCGVAKSLAYMSFGIGSGTVQRHAAA